MNGTITKTTYSPKKWNLSGLQGISDKTLETHFGLYEGYVKNTNLLNEQLDSLRGSGKVSGADPHFAEITRRLGFEYNGMRLHELYFDSLTAKPQSAPPDSLKNVLAGPFDGNFENWRADFAAVGGMRGVGWAIAYLDPTNGATTTQWVTLHEDGNLAGFVPLVVMDVWEHAFLFDYKPAERAKYIEAFFANLDWQVIAQRLESVKRI